MSRRTLQLDDRLYDYVLEHSLRENEPLRRLREETLELGERAAMQISPEQGQFMALLARAIDARRVLEIGTFTGYSAACVAAALPADGVLLACDVSEEWTAIARRTWRELGLEERIDLRIAPAVETLDQLLEDGQAGTWDMAFIDADKPSYDAYYERCLELLRPRGLILIDNVLWSGDVADPDKQDDDTVALRALNEKIHRDDRVEMSLLPLSDGITLALKR